MRPVSTFSLALLGLGWASASLSARQQEDDLVARAVAVANLEGNADLSVIDSRGLVDDIWESITDAASCAGCQSVVGLLKGLAVLGDNAFSRTLVEICKIAQVQDDDVCEGAIGLQAPIIRKAIQNVRLGSKPADLFCASMLGLCAYPDVEMFEPDFPNPKPDNSSVPPPSGKDTLKVVLYSDIHIDTQYAEGANTECDKPTCCRPFTPEDSPGQTDNPASAFGHEKCSAPVALEESMYEAINELVPDISFVIFAGDMIDYGIWNTSQEYNENTISTSYSRMADAFPVLYPAIGNHEQHPTNVIAPKHISDYSQWMYDVIADSVSGWLGPDELSTMRSFGGYSTKVPTGNLRLITLNTNFYYDNNYWMYEREMHQDPEGQIEWLVSELDAAEAAGENVWVLGHQAFGDKGALHDATSSIDRVLARYSGSIRAMFFGHTHSDHFQITYGDYGDRSEDTALITSWINPSLTPTTGRNPSFRVFDVDPDTYAIMDATVYYADMKTDPAFAGNASSSSSDSAAKPRWKKYYSARETYGALLDPPVDDDEPLGAAFWHRVTEAFEADDAAFMDYVARKSRGFRDEDECAGECKDLEICALRAARAESNCFKPELGFNFKRMKNKRDGRDEDHGIRRWELQDQREADVEEVVRASIAAVAKDKHALELLEHRVHQLED